MMKTLQNIEQLKNLIATIRNIRKGFLTNFYLDVFKHQIWINNGDFQFEQIGDTLFLSRKSKNFCNLFYCSTTREELKCSILQFESKYPQLVKMIDVLGTKIQCEPIINLLSAIGYKSYNQLMRMSRITPIENYEFYNSNVSYALLEDTRIIRKLLLDYFDERCEQIPYQEELDEYANNNRILVFKEHGEIWGFVIFESNNSTHYLRYWFVHPEHRDKKIGSKLLNSFFHEGRNTRRQLLWVIIDNENAIKRYRHYGFKEENLYDIIMSNK